MSKQDLLKIRTCVLKVNIHCDGCEQKVKELLQKVDGVYTVRVDADEGKVLVASNVDPAKLIKKLNRGGKHAEIWSGGGGQKVLMSNQNYPINPKFQNMFVDNSKGGKDKSQNHKGRKGGGQGHVGQLGLFQNTKGVHDLKVPAKEHKLVKYNLAEEEFDASDDDDGFHEYEDNFDEGEEEGFGHTTHQNKMMGDGRGPHGPFGIIYGSGINNNNNNNHKDNAGGSRNNNGNVKKGDVIDQTMVFKDKGKSYNETKSSQKGDRPEPKGGGFGDYDNNNKKNGKSDGGLLGGFLGLGKKSKKEELEEATYSNKIKNQNNGGGNNKSKEGKLEGIGFDDFGDYDHDDTISHHKNNGKSGKEGKMGQSQKMNRKGGGVQKGPSPKMGNYPMSHQMENIPATIKGYGGGYQEMQMQNTPYNNNLQQQQYMTMMMNKHQHQQATMQNNNNMMYPPATMYGMPPPPMPSHPMADPITHTFSDENVENCSVM